MVRQPADGKIPFLRRHRKHEPAAVRPSDTPHGRHMGRDWLSTRRFCRTGGRVLSGSVVAISRTIVSCSVWWTADGNDFWWVSTAIRTWSATQTASTATGNCESGSASRYVKADLLLTELDLVRETCPEFHRPLHRSMHPGVSWRYNWMPCNCRKNCVESSTTQVGDVSPDVKKLVSGSLP